MKKKKWFDCKKKKKKKKNKDSKKKRNTMKHLESNKMINKKVDYLKLKNTIHADPLSFSHLMY